MTKVSKGRLHVQKGITMHPDVQSALTELAKKMCTSESGCIAQLVLRAWRESQPAVSTT
jgi:hypothetical protein